MTKGSEEIFGEEMTGRPAWGLGSFLLGVGLILLLISLPMVFDGSGPGYFFLVVGILFAGFGAYELYGVFDGKPVFFAYYTLNSVGLICKFPAQEANPQTIRWETMRRVEPAPEDPSKLRLTIVGADPTYDPVPPTGATLIGVAFEDYKQTRAAAARVEERSFVLDPAKTGPTGQRFGDRFGVWFTQHAANAKMATTVAAAVE